MKMPHSMPKRFGIFRRVQNIEGKKKLQANLERKTGKLEMKEEEYKVEQVIYGSGSIQRQPQGNI